MATYLQWRNLQTQGKVKRLTYVTGDEAVLRNNVVATMRLTSREEDRASIVATGLNDGEVWTELNQHPLISRRAIPGVPGERPKYEQVTRHVTVRDAHKIRNWKPLDGWLREMRSVTACFESDQPDHSGPLYRNATKCPRGHQCKDEAQVRVTQSQSGRERRECKECLAAREIVVKRGMLVFTHAPRTDAQREDAIKTLHQVFGPSRAQCAILLRASGWNVGSAIEALQKLRLLGAPLTQQTVHDVLLPSEDTEFEQAIRRGDRSRAAQAAIDVAEADTERIIARLDDWLGAVTLASQMARAGQSANIISRRCGVDYGLALRLRNDAGRYTRTSTDRATEALAQASADWKAGRRIGVLETLASRW